MKKILIFFFCIFSFSAVAMEKSTTFNKEIFKKAQSEGKIVVVSSWIKYCSSCASQMKILQNAEKDFKNIKYLAFDVKNISSITLIFKQSFASTERPRIHQSNAFFAGITFINASITWNGNKPLSTSGRQSLTSDFEIT